MKFKPPKLKSWRDYKLAMTDFGSEFEWQLRVSTRARYAKLQIKPYGGLEVVVPPRFPRAQIPQLIAKHSSWLKQQLDQQHRRRQAIRLPRQLNLAFGNSPIAVLYPDTAKQLNLELGNDSSTEAIIINAVEQHQQIRQLRSFVRAEAKTRLPPRLQQIASQTGLKFNQVRIRSQKTRWGSCTNRGHISLNDQLLFLPSDTIDYLLIHELCHTRHLNHSQNFWQLVETHCPDYRNHEKLLGRSRSLVPDWFLLDLYR